MQGSGWLLNLQTALEASGLDIAEVASRLNDPDWLDSNSAAHADEALSPVQYLMISAVTGLTVPVLTGEASPQQSARVALRAKEKSASLDLLLPAQRRGAELLQAGRLICAWEAADCAERRGRIAQLRVMTSRHNWPPTAGEQTAAQVRKRMDKVGWLEKNEPIVDLVGLVEGTGIPVEFTELLPADVHGMTVHDGTLGIWDGVILINSRDTWARQRYTLAHEWGHALFGDAETTFVNDEQTWRSAAHEESRAEYFACDLLAPPRSLRRVWEQSLHQYREPESALCVVMLHFGLSRQAVLIALQRLQVNKDLLGRLQRSTASVTSQMRRAGLEDAWNESCADQDKPGASPWLFNVAMRLFTEGKVSATTVARVLDRPVDEVADELAQNGWN